MSKTVGEEEMIHFLIEDGRLKNAVSELATANKMRMKRIDPKSVNDLNEFRENWLRSSFWDQTAKKEITDFMKGIGQEIPYFMTKVGELVMVNDKDKTTFVVL
jgi:mannosyltransferase OCH1-like enzyme